MDRSQTEGPVEYGFEDWLRGYVRTVPVDVRAKHRGPARGKHLNRSILYYKKLALEILNPCSGESILDLGCATGAMTVYCAMLGAHCVGIDLSLDSLANARTYLKNTWLSKRGSDGRGRGLSAVS